MLKHSLQEETVGARGPSSFASWTAEIAAAERGDGWLAACEAAGRFLVPCRELIDALAELIGTLLGEERGPVLEVCAGRGELAAALRQSGVPVVATDLDPAAAQGVPGASSRKGLPLPRSRGGQAAPAARPVVARGVLPISAEDALAAYRPRVVLGSFVPFDAGVDEAVMRFPTVRHYVVLGARIGGQFGSPILWQHPRWNARPLEYISHQMLTRHDVWLGQADNQILQHGEAWHFRVES